MSGGPPWVVRPQAATSQGTPPRGLPGAEGSSLACHHLDVLELLAKGFHHIFHLFFHPLQEQADVTRLFLQILHVLVIFCF